MLLLLGIQDGVIVTLRTGIPWKQETKTEEK